MVSIHKSQLFINELLDKIINSGVNYMLLSGFDNNWKKNESVEIDLFIPQTQKPIFLKVIKKMGFLKRCEPANLPNHTFFVRWRKDFSLILDVKYNLNFYNYKGSLWTPIHSELNFYKREFENGIWRPDDFMCILLYAANCCWSKQGRLNQRHVENLKTYIIKYSNNLDSNNTKFTEKLFSILESYTLDTLPEAIEGLIKPYFYKSTSFTLVLKKVLKKLNPAKGNYILFLGPDGSGKTTLVKQVKNKLFLKSVDLYLGMGENNWHFLSIKKLQELSNGKSTKQILFKCVYYYMLLPIELLIRQLKLMKQMRWRFILIDRYPGYLFLKGNFLKRLYKFILPQPDLIVLLSGDPKLIAARKSNETTPERTLKEITKWRKVADVIGAKHQLELDTTENNINFCVEKIIELIRKDLSLHNKVLKHI